ncbi:MAG TPA: glycine--tRNA ligase [Candidatus Saccharimonadales bacterium]|nr:glycine--tRNA ligase [Candidatus Saccharimonadales bacterium]
MTKLSLEQLVSLAKRRGFVFQGSELYGGLAGTYDYGPLGVLLKNNLRELWWRHFVTERSDVYGLDTAILMNAKVWEASGHTGAGFVDALVEDLKTHKRYRADHLLEESGVDNVSELDFDQLQAKIKELKLKSPDGNELSPLRQFNLMFATNIGPVEDTASKAYLRPETAQGMFVNFKNVLDSMHPRLPFGLAQSGKTFRNEITPRDFLFRVREFEIMELEYFIKAETWEEQFKAWQKASYDWFERIGLAKSDIRELEVPEADRAHYSKRTVDFEYKFEGIGQKEIAALAYRTDFDLKNHTEHSGVDLSYTDPTTNDKFIPHVLEPTFGLDRHILAVMSAGYEEEEVGGEKRVVLKLKPELAPIKVAVLPLSKNEKLTPLAHEVFDAIRGELSVEYDETQSIGRRYRRQDEIGTPLCVTVDFDSLEDKAVTIRHRDTMKQERVKIKDLRKAIEKQLMDF